jgi:hypothetical protein
VLANAQIGQFAFGNLLAECANARHVNLNAQIIVLAIRIGNLGGGFTHPGSDFQNFWRISTVTAARSMYAGV